MALGAYQRAPVGTTTEDLAALRPTGNDFRNTPPEEYRHGS